MAEFLPSHHKGMTFQLVIKGDLKDGWKDGSLLHRYLISRMTEKKQILEIFLILFCYTLLTLCFIFDTSYIWDEGSRIKKRKQ